MQERWSSGALGTCQAAPVPRLSRDWQACAAARPPPPPSCPTRVRCLPGVSSCCTPTPSALMVLCLRCAQRCPFSKLSIRLGEVGQHRSVTCVRVSMLVLLDCSIAGRAKASCTAAIRARPSSDSIRSSAGRPEPDVDVSNLGRQPDDHRPAFHRPSTLQYGSAACSQLPQSTFSVQSISFLMPNAPAVHCNTDSCMWPSTGSISRCEIPLGAFTS